MLKKTIVLAINIVNSNNRIIMDYPLYIISFAQFHLLQTGVHAVGK